MRPSSTSVLCLAAALGFGFASAALAAAAPAWTVDKANSKIQFRSTFSGTAFQGGFARWDAQINFDPKNLAGSKVTVSVDLASESSGDQDRDSTLPSADWFNVAKFPRAVFTSTAIKDLGSGKYEADGTLSLKGVTKPVALPFTLTIQGTTAKMSGQAVIHRNDFGVGQGQFGGPDTVPFEVTVPVTVVAKKAG